MPLVAALGGGGAALLGGAIGGIGSLASGIIGAGASSSASKQQAAAQEQALALQQQEYAFGQQMLNPYITTGNFALNQLSNAYGLPYNNPQGISEGGPAQQSAALQAFNQSPDYQFAFQQGLQSLDRSAASQGNLISGGQLKGAQEFGQGLASQQYSNYFNRLLSLANIGQNSAVGSANLTNSAAQTLGGTTASIGATQAAGTVGSAQSLASGLQGAGSSVTQALLLSKILGTQSPSGYTPPAGVGATSGTQGGIGSVLGLS